MTCAPTCKTRSVPSTACRADGTLIDDPIVIVNWNSRSGNKWTMPIGKCVGKLLKIGNLPINSRLETYYNIEHPDNGSEWQIV
jgi:hypothetical protein